MCEVGLIFFGSLLLWLGIVGITNGEEKNNHNSSFIDMGIALTILGSLLLIIAFTSLWSNIYNRFKKKTYQPLDNPV